VTAELRALLLCDLAFQQAGNGAWHVIGIHDRVLVRALPVLHGPMVVFWSLGQFPGEAMVMVTVRDPEGAVVRAMRSMIPRLPTAMLEHAFAFHPIEFKAEGGHMVELHVAEELLAVRSFRVQRIPDTPA
jgi:hypothetical protein